MAWAYHVYIVNSHEDRLILVEHIFYSPATGTKEECLRYYNEHIGTCSYLKVAVEDDRVDDKWVEMPRSAMPSLAGESADLDDEENEPIDV
jgi:hypothetical protein